MRVLVTTSLLSVALVTAMTQGGSAQTIHEPPVSSVCRESEWLKTLGKDRVPPVKMQLPPNFDKQPEPTYTPAPLTGNGRDQECPSLVELNKLAAGSGKPDWQLHLDWSTQDQGFCEPDVQKDFDRIDRQWGTNIYQACVYPAQFATRVGRACAMQFAIASAKQHTVKADALAWNIAVATQRHNDGAVKSLVGAGNQVAAYLRTK